MSWIGGNCQGDRNYECYYLTFDTWEEFCIDSDDRCFSIYDNAGLTGIVDHTQPPPDDGGGW
jgi:hypothetical protein